MGSCFYALLHTLFSFILQSFVETWHEGELSYIEREIGNLGQLHLRMFVHIVTNSEFCEFT